MSAQEGPADKSRQELERLQQERAFLLSSLDDLDAELQAGDINADDHRVLADGYTRRAAQTLRDIATLQAGPDTIDAADPSGQTPTRTSTSSRRRWTFVLLGLLAVGALAGVLLARSVGSRHAGDTFTGNDAVTSTVSLLRNAEEALAAEDTQEALELYEAVLRDDPANPTALTYSGWLRYLQGDTEQAAELLADAVVAAPEYPDAWAFRTIVLFRERDCTAAAEALAAFDATNPPSEISQLVSQQGLRAGVAVCRVAQEAGGSQLLTLQSLGLTADDAVAAAQSVWNPTRPSEGDPLLAIRVYEAVLAAEPDHPAALLYSGVLLAQTGVAEQLAEGEQRIRRSAQVAPDWPEALLWRAWLHLGQGRVAEALADLDALDALSPSDDVAVLADDLRSQVGG